VWSSFDVPVGGLLLLAFWMQLECSVIGGAFAASEELKSLRQVLRPYAKLARHESAKLRLSNI